MIRSSLHSPSTLHKYKKSYIWFMAKQYFLFWTKYISKIRRNKIITNIFYNSNPYMLENRINSLLISTNSRFKLKEKKKNSFNLQFSWPSPFYVLVYYTFLLSNAWVWILPVPSNCWDFKHLKGRLHEKFGSTKVILKKIRSTAYTLLFEFAH